jgi:RNA-directed DNA polymerase
LIVNLFMTHYTSPAQAQTDKKLKFTSLLHHITPELLRASFLELKKRAAPGVDGETWRDYAVEFE